MLSYTVCVFICVCLGRPDEGGGGSPNQTPYLNKNNQNGARDVEREKWQGDLTCESGDAYLHANYVARWGGGESGKRPPSARQREGERGKTQQTREKQGERTTQRTDKQTKESKGAYRRDG